MEQLFTTLSRAVEGVPLVALAASLAWGIRHAAITAACERAQMQGIGLEQVLDFSCHSRRSVAILILIVYREPGRHAGEAGLAGRRGGLTAG